MSSDGKGRSSPREPHEAGVERGPEYVVGDDAPLVLYLMARDLYRSPKGTRGRELAGRGKV